jgi:uncharacterized membrane-anchored protein YitT (DUF2179 family)
MRTLITNCHPSKYFATTRSRRGIHLKQVKTFYWFGLCARAILNKWAIPLYYTLLINFNLLAFIWSNLSIQYKNFHATPICRLCNQWLSSPCYCCNYLCITAYIIDYIFVKALEIYVQVISKHVYKKRTRTVADYLTSGCTNDKKRLEWINLV